jgi:hypothetical protein
MTIRKADREQQASRARILRYMRENINDAIDPLTGEVNATLLLEDAADALGVEDGEGSDAWEIAAQVATNYNERHTRARWAANTAWDADAREAGPGWAGQIEY